MRQRTNLDTSEANFVYARVLLELNKYDKFQNLFVTDRNKIIDEICLAVIDEANEKEEDREALKFEIMSYKLPAEEKEKYFSPPLYISGLKKPEEFDKKLNKKYGSIIKKYIKEKFIN